MPKYYIIDDDLCCLNLFGNVTRFGLCNSMMRTKIKMFHSSTYELKVGLEIRIILLKSTTFKIGNCMLAELDLTIWTIY